jgi:prolyl-tRNA editing enzyme YbaK/EbsC (Cys-tRNA(Pro) deacylase)
MVCVVKTDVTDHLDEMKVRYVVKPHREAALTAEAAARERGVRVSQIVKCMIGETESRQLVAMLIPGDKRLKSSKARKRVGASSLKLVAPERLVADFGLVVGAISPTQLVGRALILADPTVLAQERITISSGDQLAGLELSAHDLLDAVGAEQVDIVSDS